MQWERCHLYPNGDVLALCCIGGSAPYGCGLVKLDRDSRFRWGYSAEVHHDVDVGEDGRIYALTQKTEQTPPAGLDSISAPYNDDFLVVLSPEGRELVKVSLLEAFRNSPYLLSGLASSSEPQAFAPPPPIPQLPGAPPITVPALPIPRSQFGKGDLFHANSVKVLSKALAARFPLFKPGQVLLSLRTPSLVAVLDLETRSIVWAVKGAWQGQHDARFLDNGHILLFDNLGDTKGARVIEFDPITHAIPWSYVGEKGSSFLAPFRGVSQRLTNGNTLVAEPTSRLVEVTPGGEVVWQWALPFAPTPSGQPSAPGVLSFTGVRRYLPEELPFLEGRAPARVASAR
jgi:hypothetical protein